MFAEAIFRLLIFLIVFCVVFLLIRKVILWYYRINQRVDLESDILTELKAIRELLSSNGSTQLEEESQKLHSAKFRVGELVVQKSTGKQMRISKVMDDLKSYSCKDAGNTSELGIFQETDLMSFKEWKQTNISIVEKLFRP